MEDDFVKQSPQLLLKFRKRNEDRTICRGVRRGGPGCAAGRIALPGVPVYLEWDVANPGLVFMGFRENRSET